MNLNSAKLHEQFKWKGHGLKMVTMRGIISILSDDYPRQPCNQWEYRIVKFLKNRR